MTRRAIALLLIATLPVACVIDGVPLPDQTDDEDNAESPSVAEGVGGVFATRSSGVTLVFGVPASVTAGATIVAASGSRQARTTAAADGSFNVALSGELAATITVSVLVSGAQIAGLTLASPASGTLYVPAGTTTTGDAAPTAVSSSTRLDSDRVTLTFPAGSFASNVAVAIANIDHGTTETAVAADDGSLSTAVAATAGNTLYVIALANTGASAPYIITVP